MRVFLLDSGTMMIDRSQLLWNVDCGVRLRFPVYSVLVEHAEGLFLFDQRKLDFGKPFSVEFGPPGNTNAVFAGRTHRPDLHGDVTWDTTE